MLSPADHLVQVTKVERPHVSRMRRQDARCSVESVEDMTLKRGRASGLGPGAREKSPG